MVSLRLAAPPELSRSSLSRLLVWALQWLLLGGVLTTLVYQVPARHTVHVGLNDSGYVQGFEDATNRWGVVTDQTDVTIPYRWSGPASALLFPQIGLPARITLHTRAWRPAGEPLPRVRVLLNGQGELGTFDATGEWEEHAYTFQAGLLKPQDVFFQIVTDPPLMVDGAVRGVQIDRATLETAAWPVIPYPGQIVGGAATTLLAAVFLRRRPRYALIAAIGLALLFLVCYRLPLLPVPIRQFWPLAFAIALTGLIVQNVAWGVNVIANAPRTLPVLRRVSLIDCVAAGTIAAWTIYVAWVGRAHVVLSIPGVEKDFRVFATRSDTFACPPGALQAGAGCVWRADGFYQLGYPFLLWLVRPLFADNPFLAARAMALVCGTLVLGAVYLLGRRMMGDGPALLALLFVALNRWMVEYSLYVGTDMPFVAACVVALLGLFTVRGTPARAFVAGLLCGIAFLLRHPGLVLLPLGCLWLWFAPGMPGIERTERRWMLPMLLLVGFAVASLPQMVVNLADTGRPFYSQQAKNVWLAVYGNTDWNRWSEARDDLALGDVILHDPGRFTANWWRNVRSFWGTGSEDISEFGQALALRLLAFPANLLAFGGIGLWVLRGNRSERFLVLVAGVYMTAIGVGFLLPRFSLPLVPLWGLAAAALLRWLWQRRVPRDVVALRGGVTVVLVLLVLIGGSAQAGAQYVLEHQDADAVAATAMIRRVVGSERFVAQLPPEDMLAKYSAIAHLATDEPTERARFQLLTADQPAPEGFTNVGQTGRYTLYRTEP